IHKHVPLSYVNTVRYSGSNAIMLDAKAIKCGDAENVVAGGMESMSQTPFYNMAGRTGTKFGNAVQLDGIIQDGLLDAYNKKTMGFAADATAVKHNISREEQDAFAIESYTRTANAWKAGKFADEIVPVEVPQRKGDAIIVSEDEEYKSANFEKFASLRPAFEKDGTVTAANASTLNDGASALVLMSKEKADELGLKPLAKIISYGDAAHEPELFTTAPAKAVPVALKKAGLDK